MITETVMAIALAGIFIAAVALPFVASEHQVTLASASLLKEMLDARPTQSQARSGRHEGPKAEKAVPSPSARDWVGSYRDGPTHILAAFVS